jgi:hypothetical protein
MNSEKLIYSSLCGTGGILIGLFANRLNTMLGAGLFAFGIAILVFSIIKLNK